MTEIEHQQKCNKQRAARPVPSISSKAPQDVNRETVIRTIKTALFSGDIITAAYRCEQ